MLVIRDNTGGYPDCQQNYYDFERLDDGVGDFVLFYGYGACRDQKLLDQYKDTVRVFIAAELPSGFDGEPEATMKIGENFDRVFSVCPYTAKWFNEVKYDDVYRVTHLPTSIYHMLHDPVEKTHDVMYWGGIYHKDHVEIMEAMGNYRYSYCTIHTEITHPPYRKYITHRDLPRKQLWDVTRHTKVMLCSNLLYFQPKHIEVLKTVENIKDNEAFKQFETGLVPQIKSRAFEAAMCRTLLLVREDPWDVLSTWFEPEVDYALYKPGKLKQRLDDVLDNWSKYEEMAERAYDKVVGNYTSEHFIERIQNEVDYTDLGKVSRP